MNLKPLATTVREGYFLQKKMQEEARNRANGETVIDTKQAENALMRMFEKLSK